MSQLIYLQGYPDSIQKQAQTLIERGKLSGYLRKRYPDCHNIRSEKALYNYCMTLKNHYLKKSPPLSKVSWDKHIHAVRDALGTHTFISRVQGSKLKAKHEIRVAHIFRHSPEAFLQMILVHELAHFREKSHNKAFYQLCCHMLPDYHQLELDMRLFLTQQEMGDSPWS
ncbi:MAG: DUF45 domain-containing protein [Marinobacterium sp.]|nr:DUF45 domain-containing protein [Marinobacterium sp.]